jgi:iron(III) transport system substrate-binding protein
MKLEMNYKAAAIAAIAMSLALGSGGASAQDGMFGLDASVIEAAKAEGSLTFYSAQAQNLADRTASAFKEAFPGIEVNVIRAASGTLANRFSTEYEAGVFEADVMDISNLELFESQPDWFVPMNAELVPGLANWPQQEIGANYFNATQGPQLIAYNPNLIPADVPLKTWEDILRPEFAGKGMLVDPRASNTYLNWVNLMYETYGEEFVTKLRAQNFTLVEGGSQGAQQVVAGAYWFVIPPSFAHAQPLIDAGAPLAVTYPSENSDVVALGPMHSWAMMSKAPHPNLARVFLAWVTTEAGQQVVCGGNSASVILTDYEGCPKPAARFKSADLPIAEDRKEDLLRLLGLQ